MDPTNPFSKKFKSSPLTLDRILEGRPIAAQDSPLLRLPVMILSDIIKYMDSESLESLALVNSDCRQLARSCQFANVDMDYSVRSHHLFGLLVREATARSITKDRLTLQPSLGACIRYINLSSDHYHDEVDVIDELRARPLGEGGEDDDGHTDRLLSTDEWRNLTRDILTKVWSLYDPTLILVLTSLPHLEIINWTTGVTVDCHLLTSLKASTVRHLRLHGYLESENLALDLGGKDSWPLLSLDIDVRSTYHVNGEKAMLIHTSTFFSKIFQACSSTLRFLRLSQVDVASDSQQTAVSLTAEFPHLCSLNLTPMTPLGHSTLQSFLQSQRLSTLIVDFSDSVTRECLDQAGYYPELHTFIWTGFEIPSTASLRSLEHNNHFMEFGTEYHQSPSLLDRVVSLLASFANLRILSLLWDGTAIPNSSLLSMASITSLNSLHISSGNQNGWQHDWIIDHEAIRYYLAPLRNLKRLLFTRDSYPLNISLQGENQAGYYSYRMPTPADMIDFLENSMREDQEEEDLPELVWETVHREYMAWHAEKYATTFPELEWIHVGQLSFTFEQGPDGKKKAVVIDPKRNENFPVMETMFGISAE